MVAANIFTVKNNMLLYIVDYYSMFHVNKNTDSLWDDSLLRISKIAFVEFGLPK